MNFDKYCVVKNKEQKNKNFGQTLLKMCQTLL